MRVRILALASLASLSAFSLAVFPNNGPDTHFLSVGQYAGASAVAIDPFWVLTARHIDGGTFTTPELGSFTVLEDHDGEDVPVPEPGQDGDDSTRE